jgi:transcriptional regulator with XRE-family HTH domain
MAKSKSSYGRGTGKLHPVDMHVGARVRQRRVLQGMTQTVLANALGLTFQQVQKYELGTNRISASRLHDLSRVFDVPINYFFEDMPPEVATSSQATKGLGKAKKLPSYELDPMTTQETMSLVRAYYKIKDAGVRKRIYEMTKTLGSASA